MTEADFGDFTFGNPVRFLTDMNPDFFKGIGVEEEVAQLQAAGR